jgi:hypothetical protein
MFGVVETYSEEERTGGRHATKRHSLWKWNLEEGTWNIRLAFRRSHSRISNFTPQSTPQRAVRQQRAWWQEEQPLRRRIGGIRRIHGVLQCGTVFQGLGE